MVGGNIFSSILNPGFALSVRQGQAGNQLYMGFAQCSAGFIWHFILDGGDVWIADF